MEHTMYTAYKSEVLRSLVLEEQLADAREKLALANAVILHSLQNTQECVVQ